MSEDETSVSDGTTLLKPQLSKVLGWLALVSMIVLALFGLWGAPKDAVQGDAQRLMYLHVPAAWIAYLAFGSPRSARHCGCGRARARRSGTASRARRLSSG